MLIFNDTQTLLNNVDTFSSRPIITIDGDTGVGKTTLAKQLERALGARMLDVDKYVIKKTGKYFSAIDQLALQRDLNLSLLCSQQLVVCGLTIDALIDRISWPDAYRIYVKRMKPARLWYLGLEIESKVENSDSFDSEIIKYHKEYTPHLCCDCLLEQ